MIDKAIIYFQNLMLQSTVDFLAKSIPSHKIDFLGPNSLLFSSAPYYVLLFIMAVGISLFEITDNPYILLFIIYAFIPLVDELISMDTRNPNSAEAKQLANQLKYQVPLYVTAAVDWAILFYALNQYCTNELTFYNFFKLLGLVVIISNLNAAQFSISHEIMHKPGWRRVIGTLHMLKTLNMHFTYEHLYGHHRKVATPEDPASAQKNQNVYLFFIRSYFGAYASVYNMEKAKNKKFFLNAAVVSVVGSVIFCTLIIKAYGLQAFFFFLIQVLGAVFYLQVINFIEHYGLQRKKLPNGQYEKVTIKHSWNAPHRLSNYLFFKLQRHSDHHQNAMKPYQILQTHEQSPQLPHGYIVMTVMALFPKIFKRIMNPLVQSYNRAQQTGQPLQKRKNLQKIAIIETKKFIIELSICLTGLFVISCFWVK